MQQPRELIEELVGHDAADLLDRLLDSGSEIAAVTVVRRVADKLVAMPLPFPCVRFEVREIVESDGLTEAADAGARGEALVGDVVDVQLVKMVEMLEEVPREHTFRRVVRACVEHGEQGVHEAEVAD